MVIYPEMFSIKPDTDVTKCFKNLFNTVSETAVKKTVLLPHGKYVFRSKSADERVLYITNTIGENEYKSGEKKNMHKIALDLRNINDLEFDGNGSTFIIDGKMTNIVIENCNNITLKNFTVEVAAPDIHKITVTKASPFYITFEIEKDCNYTEEDGKYYWLGTDYKTGFLDNCENGGITVTATPDNLSHPLKDGIHLFSDCSSLKEVAPGVFNARYITPKNYVKGQIFYLYSGKRKNVGIFTDKSKNIKLENIKQRFSYSLGFVAQNSENITLNNVDFSAGEASRNDICSLADFIQISMCRGNISIKNCNFDFAGGNAINVHGIHFIIVKTDGDKMTVKFSHPQTYGFECIRDGDIIAFIDPKTLIEVGRTKVLKAELHDKYYYDLSLVTYSPPLGVGGVIENVSANCNVKFSDNIINRIVTSGVLVTTRGRVIIKNNKFLNTGMSGIFISDDARSLYESGYVTDVTIKNNAFINCGENAVLIKPEITKYGGPVHQNIKISDNLFILNNTHAVNATACDNIVLKNNVYKGKAKYNRKIITEDVTGLVDENI